MGLRGKTTGGEVEKASSWQRTRPEPGLWEGEIGRGQREWAGRWGCGLMAVGGSGRGGPVPGVQPSDQVGSGTAEDGK